jgi:heat shock protein HslJ
MILTAMLAGPAAALEFPIEKPFRTISISGYDVQKIGMTLRVVRDGGQLRAVGHAGCNDWSAVAVIRDDQIDFTDIVTTRKFCGGPRMKSEEAFLTSLRSARRWRVDDKNRLIVEGDAARLLLTAGGVAAPAEKKPAKKK